MNTRRPSSTLGAPDLFVTPALCHSACAPDCNECVRTRSESVGAEWETRLDADGRSMLRWLWWGAGTVGALLIGVHFLARWLG